MDLGVVMKKKLLKTAALRRRVLPDLARGIAYLHSRCIVHRDIKPENVLMRTNNESSMVVHAKICDFGTSRHLLLSQQCTVYAQTVGSKGTLAYMSPEVLCDRERMESKRSWDVWSFGLVACHVASTQSSPKMYEMKAEDSKRMALDGEIAELAMQCRRYSR